MAGKTAPIAIGTRGTVGSLIRREIEYFQRFDQDPVSKNSTHILENHNAPRSKAILSSLLMVGWRRKRRRSDSSSFSSSSSFSRSRSTSFLPRICSAVDVTCDIPGFTYRNLNAADI